MEVREIREAVNLMFGNIAKASVSQKEAALRRVAFSSPKPLRKLIDAVAGASESYDEKADLDGYYQFRRIPSGNPTPFPGMLTKPVTNDASTLKTMVLDIIGNFKAMAKAMAEDNNLWELLRNGSTPRHERASLAAVRWSG